MTSAMEVNSWAQLAQAMSGPPDGSRAEIIFLRSPSGLPYEPIGPITVNRPILLRTLDGDVTINRLGTMLLYFFNVGAGGTLTLQGSNGMLTLDGGGIQVATPLIHVNGGTLNMHGMVHLQNNHNTDLLAGNGGAVYVTNGGTFNMHDGTIGSTDPALGNMAASNGGGVYVESGSLANPGFVMSGGTIINNRAVSGGGVYLPNIGVFRMDGGTISSNRAFNNGGGVFVGSGGSFTKNGGNIFGLDGGVSPRANSNILIDSSEDFEPGRTEGYALHNSNFGPPPGGSIDIDVPDGIYGPP
jgi:hypothetical protein